MSDNGRISVIFALHIALYFLLGELNFFLGQFSLNFHGDALLLVFFGLYINRMGGLVAISLMGFLADAAHPVPYGTYVAGYLSIWLFIIWGQRRIRRQNPLHVNALAATAQGIWLLALTVILSLGNDGMTFHWTRIFTEILFSCTLTFLLAWHWCKLQRELLYSLGWNLEAELPGI